MPMKAKILAEFLSAVKAARGKINVVTIPVLIFHGTDDHLVPFSASEYINSKVRSTDKTFEVRMCLLAGYLYYNQIIS